MVYYKFKDQIPLDNKYERKIFFEKLLFAKDISFPIYEPGYDIQA